MRLTRTLALAATVAALALGHAQAQESDADKDWSKVVIGTEGAYPPFNFLDASGELQGFDVDIAKALCAEMKVECSFVTQDWDGIIPALQNGNFDALVASMSITPEREEQIAFTNKYYQTPPAIAVPKDSDITEATAEALAGKAIGAQTSTTHARAAESYFPDADVRQYPTAEEYKLDIESGRVDAVVDDVVVLDEWLKSDAGACCKLLDTLTARPGHSGSRRGALVPCGDLVQRIDHGIEGQHGRGVARLVLAHRLQIFQIGETAFRRRAVLLEHPPHGLAGGTQFFRRRPDDVARHHRGRGLAKGAGLHLMGEVRHDAVCKFQVDRHGRAAQLGMRRGAGIGSLQPPDPGDVSGQFQYPRVVDVVDHMHTNPSRKCRWPCHFVRSEII